MEYLTLLYLLLPLFFAILFLFRRDCPSTLPPSPSKLPIIGHLHLLTDMPHIALAQLADKLGPILHLQIGQVPTLVLSSPRLAREVLKTHDHAFASRPQLIAAQWLSFGCSDITFSVYGPYWRQARKICVTELLSAKRVNSFQLVRDEEVTRLALSVAKDAESETDMSERFFGLANDVLCRVAFGRRFSEGGSKYQLSEVLAETQALLAGFSIGDFFPGMEWVNSVTGLKRRLERNLKDLRGVCDEIIGKHEAKRDASAGTDAGLGSDVSGREDFVDVLLRVRRSGDLEVPITDDNLKALVLDMFVAGTDTTSATLEWSMTELARHPSIMSKAQQEVRTVVGSKRQVQETDLQDLVYMKAIIKETLRLHPPVPLLVPRESIQRCKIDGYDIPVGTRVLINTYAIGRDPHVWENPLSYNPDRFVGSNIDIKGQDFELLPFGGGRRGCPGYTFALATVELALASLLYHFDWELPRGVGPDDVDLGEIFGLATRKRAPLVLLPRRREEYMMRLIDA